MRQFEISPDGIRVHGKRGFLIGGDVHYFRINPDDWRDRLEKTLQCGCNIVSVYIPWMEHEVEEGEFDFTGRTHPRRDLLGFLELLKEMDVPAIAKPGPYVYSELPAGGIPKWFVKSHPEAHAKVWDGEGFVPHREGDGAPISYLHPAYLAAADRWLREVCAVIGPFQRSRGGSVEAVQICNEIGGVHIWSAGYDQNPEAIGLDDPDGLYPTFLRERSSHSERSEESASPSPPQQRKADSSSSPRNDLVAKPEHTCRLPVMGKNAAQETDEGLKLDYGEFYWNRYIPKYVSWLVERFRAHGIDELLTTNIAFPEMVVLMRRALDGEPEVMPGLDLYYTFIHTHNLDARNIAYCCEFGPQVLAQVSKWPPTSLEFQAGAPDELGYPLYGPHTYVWALWSFISGYEGLNLYVIAGGNNIPRAGREGGAYDYQAPISAAGELRDTYFGFQRAFREASEMLWLLETRRRYDLALLLCDQPGFRDNPLRLVNEGLFRNHYSAEVLLLDQLSAHDLAKHRVIWAAPGKRLSPGDQDRLANYVLQGGTLVLSGEPPVSDTDMLPCTILLDRLGVSLSDAKGALLLDGQEVGGASRVIEAEGIVSAIAELPDGRPAAAAIEAGRGKVVVAPFETACSQLVDVKLYAAICAAAGLKPSAYAKRARVIVREFADGRKVWFALNYHPIALDEVVTVDGKEFEVRIEPWGVVQGEC